MPKTVTFLALSLILNSVSAFALVGTISFTQQEKAEHANKVSLIAETAAECLNAYYKDHVSSFHRRGGVTKYFGNRRYVKGETPARRADGKLLTPIRNELRKKGKPVSLEDEMTSISCVDLARVCLAEGFSAVGQSAFWERIDAFNKENRNIGPAILVGLQSLGWRLMFWNPDPPQNRVWDAADKLRNPTNSSRVWGYHEATYNSVMKKNIYYEYQIDDKTSLVGFGTQPPKAFMEQPFFVGFAHIGYHVFLGTQGEVVEAHSVRSLFGLDNIEMTSFNPLGGGAPKSTDSEVYRSGVIAVPPR